MALRSTAPPPPATTGGGTVYAVGDIHGRADLLERLLSRFESDLASIRNDSKAAVVFLGDYVDRGQDSRKVIDHVLNLQHDARFEVRALKGNHEQALLEFLRNAKFGTAWAEYGALQTLLSYGVNPPRMRSRPDHWEAVRLALLAALPESHLHFLSTLELTARYGDYVFVHAGIRPGVPLSAQEDRDLLGIREEFLRAPGPHEAVIVHGHTPELEPFLGRHRIGIDTGAYATGVLTAIRLNGIERKIIQAG